MIKAVYAMNWAGFFGGGNGHMGMPWPKCSRDMKRFRELTEGHIVLMGHNTWKAMGEKPLPNRQNWVVTTKQELYSKNAASFKDSIDVRAYYRIWSMSNRYLSGKDLWIIGGKKTIEESIDYVDELHISIINDHSPGDTLHPKVDLANFSIKSVERYEDVNFYVLKRNKN